MRQSLKVELDLGLLNAFLHLPFIPFDIQKLYILGCSGLAEFWLDRLTPPHPDGTIQMRFYRVSNVVESDLLESLSETSILKRGWHLGH